MNKKNLSAFKYNIFEKSLDTLIKCYNKLLLTLFYLPWGGEASFREKCVKFTGLREGDRILDLCCGTGKFATAIEEQGFAIDLVGIDISKQAIQIAKAKNWNIPVVFMIANANDLPFESSRFDKCIISFGLHHMSRYDRLRTLSEIRRTLSPGGALYTFEYDSPNKGIKRLTTMTLAKLDKSKEAYQMVKEASLIGEIAQVGFRIEKRV